MIIQKDQVAVITGAASGIGRALAEKCAEKGMRLVLADIDAESLKETQQSVAEAGAEVLSVKTDVSKEDDIRRLAEQTMAKFGRVNLLCNNAGVGAGASLWESSSNECQWVIGVNLWSVIHGVRHFVPSMIAQKEKCHIVNTASVAGVTSFHPSALYQLTKHAVVALSEQLFHDMAIRRTGIGVSVLCPGFVNTAIMESESRRPERYRDESSGSGKEAAAAAVEAAFRKMIAEGMPPGDVADTVLDAVENETFYILTHPAFNTVIKARVEDMVSGRNPRPIMPPDGI